MGRTHFRPPTQAFQWAPITDPHKLRVLNTRSRGTQNTDSESSSASSSCQKGTQPVHLSHGVTNIDIGISSVDTVMPDTHMRCTAIRPQCPGHRDRSHRTQPGAQAHPAQELSFRNIASCNLELSERQNVKGFERTHVHCYHFWEFALSPAISAVQRLKVNAVLASQFILGLI